MNAPISVEPAQAAGWAIEFLRTATVKFDDDERVRIVRALLLAMASGALIVTPAPPPTPPSNPSQPE